MVNILRRQRISPKPFPTKGGEIKEVEQVSWLTGHPNPHAFPSFNKLRIVAGVSFVADYSCGGSSRFPAFSAGHGIPFRFRYGTTQPNFKFIIFLYSRFNLSTQILQ